MANLVPCIACDGYSAKATERVEEIKTQTPFQTSRTRHLARIFDNRSGEPRTSVADRGRALGPAPGDPLARPLPCPNSPRCGIVTSRSQLSVQPRTDAAICPGTTQEKRNGKEIDRSNRSCWQNDPDEG